MDRIISFSIPPTDTASKEEVQKLKDHCAKTGTNFSFLILRAIRMLNKELKL
jgi:hypothetical protein